MGNTKVTLAVIATKLDAMKEQSEEAHGEINTHLVKLNGQVATNTNWRNQSKGAVKLGAWIMGSGGILAIVFTIIKYMGGI